MCAGAANAYELLAKWNSKMCKECDARFGCTYMHWLLCAICELRCDDTQRRPPLPPLSLSRSFRSFIYLHIYLFSLSVGIRNSRCRHADTVWVGRRRDGDSKSIREWTNFANLHCFLSFLPNARWAHFWIIIIICERDRKCAHVNSWNWCRVRSHMTFSILKYFHFHSFHCRRHSENISPFQ